MLHVHLAHQTGYEGMQHVAVTVLLFLLSIASFRFHGAKLYPAESVLFPLHKCSDLDAFSLS